MPVYHITLRAYRTWRPDNPRGYVRRGEGILPPDEEKARQYDEAAAQPPVMFEREHQRVLVDGVRDICARRGWRAHIIVTDDEHVHTIISWRDHETTWQDVRDTLKRLLGMMLTQHIGEKGRHWFVRKGSRKRVRARNHFDYLMDEYLPDHRGLGWSERAGGLHGYDPDVAPSPRRKTQ